MSYCLYCEKLPEDNLHRIYHDTQYGFPLHDDDELFGRLILEINQAGLSWDLMLKKEENFRRAFAQFSIQDVAAFSEDDRLRLLGDAGIVRNKLKINAVIYNAQKILEIKREFVTFKQWLDSHAHLSKEDWLKLFKKNFKFVGGEIVNEFLMSTGYLPGAHDKSCPTYSKTIKLKPLWLKNV